MPLELFFITNNPIIASIADENEVDRIWIDLEVLGKEERQKNMNTVKSNHSVKDISIIKSVLKKSKLMVRINPWNSKSVDEIESVITAGAEYIMLPMWKTRDEVVNFLSVVNGRIKTMLLLETKEAVQCIDDILKLKIDEIHIGLNDLHLSYGMKFMFELLSNGVVESLCKKFKTNGIKYGFGGIASLGSGLLSANNIVMEHYRLGSTMVILSRSFCELKNSDSTQTWKEKFHNNMIALRNYEVSMSVKTEKDFIDNMVYVQKCVNRIIGDMK